MSDNALQNLKTIFPEGSLFQKILLQNRVDLGQTFKIQRYVTESFDNNRQKLMAVALVCPLQKFDYTGNVSIRVEAVFQDRQAAFDEIAVLDPGNDFNQITDA